jgi:GTP pyrophosphokinase
VLDFAYHVHTEVGHRCRGAKVNGRIVPLTFQPQSGDRMEILTTKSGRAQPRLACRRITATSTPRVRRTRCARGSGASRTTPILRSVAHVRTRAEAAGADDADLAKLPTHFHLKNHDELLVTLALGEITPGQIARVLQEAAQPPEITAVGRRCRRDRRSTSITARSASKASATC